MRITTAVFVLLFLATIAIGAPIPSKPATPSIHLDQNTVLYITIMQNLDDRYGRLGETDRFHYMEQEIENAMEITGFPMEYKVQRWSSKKVPAGNPELMINVSHWGDNKMGELEVRFFARIKEDASLREKKKVGRGYFRERDGAYGFTSNRLLDTYNKLFRMAIIDVLKELNRSFEVSFEGEEIDAEDSR